MGVSLLDGSAAAYLVKEINMAVNQINGACPSDHQCCGSTLCCDDTEQCDFTSSQCVPIEPFGRCCYCSSNTLAADGSSPRCIISTEADCINGASRITSWVSFIRWEEGSINDCLDNGFCDSTLGGPDDLQYCN